MSDDRIYVRFKGKVLGPLTSKKTQELIQRGQITRMHELSSDGMSWMRAEEFGDLFRAQPETSTAARSQGQPASQSGRASGTAGAAASAPRAGEPPEQSVEWYAHLDGENRGPFASNRLLGMIDSGDVDGDTLVWRSGFDEWRTAAESFPEKFGVSPAAAPVAQTPQGTPQNPGKTVPPSSAVTNLARTQTLVRFLAISILVFSSLGVLYFVTGMIVGSEANWAVGQGSQVVVFGLIGLITNALWIAGAILLLRYASSLKGILEHPETTLVEASQRLRTFWQYCSIVVLLFEIVFVGGAIVLVVMLAAMADSVS